MARVAEYYVEGEGRERGGRGDRVGREWERRGSGDIVEEGRE